MMGFRDRFDRSKRKTSSRTQRLGVAFFWLIVIAYAYVIPSTPNFNTESHLFLTFSMVDRHSINIDHYHRRLGDESFVHGHYYSDKAPGLSLLAVPAYAVAEAVFHIRGQRYGAPGTNQYVLPRNTAYLRYIITYVLLVLPSAFFAVLLWLFMSRFVSRGWAMVATGVYALGTTAYSYSMWFFSHQIAAIALFSAFMLLYRSRRLPPARAGFLRLGVAGLLASFAVISEYPTALVVVCLAAYVVAVYRWKLKALLAFAAGAVPCSIAELTYNTLAFGRPLSTGYMNVHSAIYVNHITASGPFGLAGPLSYGVQLPTWDSLWQITFGTYRGIFSLCPVLLLFLPGIVIAWKRRELRAELILCAAVVGLYFLMDASRPQDLNGWSGGDSVASRHLVPMLPFMILPIGIALDRAWMKTLLLISGAFSVAVMWSIAITGWSVGFPYDDSFPLYHQVLGHLQAQDVELSWGSLLGLTGLWSLAPMLAVVGLLTTRIFWVYRHVPDNATSESYEELTQAA